MHVNRVERLLRDDNQPPAYESMVDSSNILPNMSSILYSRSCRPTSPPLSPISETPPRSVSAAVSDESVAGDSGVFEASHKSNFSPETSQVQIRLRYHFKVKFKNNCGFIDSMIYFVF